MNPLKYAYNSRKLCFEINSYRFIIYLLFFMKFDGLSKVKYFQLIINYVQLIINYVVIKNFFY